MSNLTKINLSIQCVVLGMHEDGFYGHILSAVHVT